MKDRAYIAHAGLAVCAIFLAAIAAWSPATYKESGVVMVPGHAERLSGVEWHEELYDVVLTRTGEDKKIKVAVTKRHRPPKEGEPPPPVIKKYPGSQKAEDLFEDLAPLKAARRLGAVDPEQLAALGLEEPANKLVLRFNGDQKVVELGSATYGSGDRYARAQSGEVFLLRSRLLSGLRNGATSLLDRRALAIEPDKVRRVTITAGGRERNLTHRYHEDRDKAFYADPAVPDEKLEKTSNWLDRVLKLRIADVVDQEPIASADLKLVFYNGKQPLGSLELWSVQDKVALARSSFFDTAVSISKANAEAVLRDLADVLSEGR